MKTPSLNVSLRYSYRVPVYSKTGKLTGFSLEHVVAGNRIAVEDLNDLPDYKNDVNLLANVWKPNIEKKLAEMHHVPETDLHLITFRGLSVARHLPGAPPFATSPEWV